MRSVVLTAGVSIDADVWRFALDLEGRGVTFAVDDEGRLLAGPSCLLTPEDVQAIRAARFELKRLADYCAKTARVM